MSVLDRLYSNILHRWTFFDAGWGDENVLQNANINKMSGIRPVQLNIQWDQEKLIDNKYYLQNGNFFHPMAYSWPPIHQNLAKIQLVRSIQSVEQREKGPLCLHFPGTGDEGMERRLKAFAVPLVTQFRINSLIIEGPLYGDRRPQGQVGPRLRQVSDLLGFGVMAVKEGVSLIENFLQLGFGPIGVAGISMGGLLASLVGQMCHRKVVLVPCISGHSAAPIFTQGQLSKRVNWKNLSCDKKINSDLAAKKYMEKLLSVSDVRHYPRPVEGSVIKIVAADNDAYVFKKSNDYLIEYFRPSDRYWIKGGHVSSYLFYRKKMVEMIAKGFKEIS